MRLSSDFWLALFFLAVSGVAAFLTRSLPGGGVQTELGSAFFPWLMVGGIALFSVLLLIRSLWRPPAKSPEGEGGNPVRVLGKLALFLLFMLAYALLFAQFGFLISTGAFFVVAMLALGERRLLHFLVIPACITAGVYLVFTQIMKVYIP